MKTWGLLMFALVWGLWIASTGSAQRGLIGLTFGLVYFGLGVGLLLLKAETLRALQVVFKTVGLGFICLSIGETLWLLTAPDGASSKANTLITSLPYYIANVFFVVAALISFRSAQRLLGTSMVWLVVAIGVALAIGGYNFSVGYADLASMDASQRFVYWLDAINAGLGGLASSVFLLLGVLTWGGRFSDVALPAALGFGIRMIGDISFTALGDQYVYGTLPDWFFLIGTSILFFYLIHSETPVGSTS